MVGNNETTTKKSGGQMPPALCRLSLRHAALVFIISGGEVAGVLREDASEAGWERSGGDRLLVTHGSHPFLHG